MSNDIINNLGADEPYDPLAIGEVSNELLQSALRDRMETVALLRSANYETFPLYAESFLMAIIKDLYEQDAIFRYDEDPKKSRVVIAKSFNGRSIEDRDGKPLFVVAFQSAVPEEIVLDNTMQADGINAPLKQKKGIIETSSFRVSVLHHNRNLTLFLGQQVRGAIASCMGMMRQAFKLQKVYPPTIQGPGQVDEYDDLFGCFIDLRVQTFPRWEVKAEPKYIRKILLRTTEIAGSLMQEAIVEQSQQ